MLRSENFGKVVAGILLVTFCAASIIFQNISLKNYYTVKAQQESTSDQSFSGPFGFLEEENQTTSSTSMEEEEDDYKTESVFLTPQRYAVLTLRHFLHHEHLFSEHFPEIVSPPPQA